LTRQSIFFKERLPRSQNGNGAQPDDPPMNLSATAGLSAITTKLSLRDGEDRRFADWQAAFTRAATGFAGFLSMVARRQNTT
jgi:hypothetical protein